MPEIKIPDRSREIEVTNLGQDTDTFALSVSSTDSVIAVVTPTTLSIPAGETRKVTLSFRGKNIDNGEFQGFLKINAANSPLPVLAPMLAWLTMPLVMALHESSGSALHSGLSPPGTAPPDRKSVV